MISVYTYNQIRKIKNESFERGLHYGREVAIHDLRDRQLYDCEGLSEDEKASVLKYLTDNNLEFGYNVIAGGFYIAKKKHKQQDQWDYTK
jgi:hypothetical protein